MELFFKLFVLFGLAIIFYDLISKTLDAIWARKWLKSCAIALVTFIYGMLIQVQLFVVMGAYK